MSTPNVSVLVFNRKPQTYNVPRFSDAKRDPSGSIAGFIACGPGFSLSSRDEVSSAGLDRMNPHPNTLQLVWIDPDVDPPHASYTTLRDLGREDTKLAIQGTHDLRILDALASSPRLEPFLQEHAKARAESIRSGKPSALGRSMAVEEPGGMIDMGMV